MVEQLLQNYAKYIENIKKNVQEKPKPFLNICSPNEFVMIMICVFLHTVLMISTHKKNVLPSPPRSPSPQALKKFKHLKKENLKNIFNKISKMEICLVALVILSCRKL